MAVPKKKPSRRLTRTRRSAWIKKQKRKAFQECRQCGELKLPHRVCPHCGFYRGEKVTEVETISPEEE